MKPDNMVFVAVPSYDGNINMLLAAALSGAGNTDRSITFLSSSLLAHGFNQMYAQALNSRKDGTTHFLMVHSDIIPEEGFMDKMLAIAEAKEADILSVVLPIKNAYGLSSTAIDNGTWFPSRFSMRQLDKMPPTFTSDGLLVNTGLMLVDIRKPWAEKFHFNIQDSIIRNAQGQFEARCISEDWFFSRQARKEGAKIFATREIRADHFGTWFYQNQGAWGSWQHDLQNGKAVLE